MKLFDNRARLIGFVGLNQTCRRRLHTRPISTQRFDDGGQYQPFDIGTRGIMRAQLGAFFAVERAFEQGAENRWFNIVPFLFG